MMIEKPVPYAYVVLLPLLMLWVLLLLLSFLSWYVDTVCSLTTEYPDLIDHIFLLHAASRRTSMLSLIHI